MIGAAAHCHVSIDLPDNVERLRTSDSSAMSSVWRPVSAATRSMAVPPKKAVASGDGRSAIAPLSNDTLALALVGARARKRRADR